MANLTYKDSKAVLLGDLFQRTDKSHVSPQLLLAYSLFWSVLLTTFAIAYVEFTYRLTRKFYFEGKLRRYWPLPTDRQLLANFLGAGAFIAPNAFIYFYFLYDPAHPMQWDFRPLDILVGLTFYLFSHDAYFYHIHHHSHSNKVAYHMLHKLHHEYTHSMNVFMTAYGELAENLLDVGMGFLIYLLFFHFFLVHSFWTFTIPLSLAVTTTILGHSGFAMDP